MVDLDLAYTPAVELVRLIREKSLSPVELMENCLARIEELNPKLNCFCFAFPDEALARAREAEEKAVSGAALGPMHGLPVAIKDVTPTAGKTTTRGSKMYEHWVPEEDALIVRRLVRAGAIMVGKTTTPEFAYDSFTASPLWGITRNPWNTERTPGGSSGGSGAAVAAGCVPLAEGTDMGGSVRIPASFCGLVGLKPSLGRIPMDILPTVFDTISHFGPLARSVADAALFMNVTGGPCERDMLSLPDTLEFPIPPEFDVRGMRLALSPDLGYYAIDDEVEQCLRGTAEALREAGATLEEVELGWSRGDQRCVVRSMGRLSRRLLHPGLRRVARPHGPRGGVADRAGPQPRCGDVQANGSLAHAAVAPAVRGLRALRCAAVPHHVHARPSRGAVRLRLPAEPG